MKLIATTAGEVAPGQTFQYTAADRKVYLRLEDRFSTKVASIGVRSHEDHTPVGGPEGAYIWRDNPYLPVVVPAPERRDPNQVWRAEDIPVGATFRTALGSGEYAKTGLTAFCSIVKGVPNLRSTFVWDTDTDGARYFITGMLVDRRTNTNEEG